MPQFSRRQSKAYISRLSSPAKPDLAGLQSAYAENPLLAHHQRLGNKAMQRLLRCGAIRAKLAVSHPGDPDEQEADRVAEQVLRMPEPAATGRVTTPAPGKEPRIQRMCAGCEEEEEEAITLQAKVAPGRTPDATPAVQAQVNALGGGQPLPASVRAVLEPRFGYDFSQVRIHTDARAAESARAVNALAYTVGRDIVFGVGQYAPGTSRGQRLMAHELTHVVQQNSQGSINTRGFQSTGVPMLQRIPVPRRPFEEVFRPPPTSAPRPAAAAPATHQVQFTVPDNIQRAVEAAFQIVAGNPANFESDFIDILLAPEYDRGRITINFFIRQFPAVYGVLDTDLRAAIRSQFPESEVQEQVFDAVVSNMANTLFLDLARQWERMNPRFGRRLEQERRRRERQPPVFVPPGARIV